MSEEVRRLLVALDPVVHRLTALEEVRQATTDKPLHPHAYVRVFAGDLAAVRSAMLALLPQPPFVAEAQT